MPAPIRGRVEPTVFLAMVSPITVLLMALVIVLVVLLGGPWWLAVVVAAAVWVARVLVARAVARRVRSLPRRIDPFALREPWRFHVRDALAARRRFGEAVDGTAPGPVHDRLVEVTARIDEGVEACWVAAQRGQSLADARRRIDTAAIERDRDAAHTSPDARAALDAQLASAARMDALLTDTRTRLDTLEARLGEAAASALELAHRATDARDLDRLSADVETAVVGLETVRTALE